MAASISIPHAISRVGERVIGASSTVTHVLENLERAAQRCGRSEPPLLVAASKGQPIAKIQWAYGQGVRHFGENYVQEFESKARYIQNHTKCSGIKWHFIGHLQLRKTSRLTNIPGLWMVETLDSISLAQKLNSCWALRENDSHLLKILVQVNTSKEESKHGCAPEQCEDLVQFITEECEHLDFRGLMTIGRMGHSVQEHGQNPDFKSLATCRDRVKKKLGLLGPLELSMGMSGDYEHAVELGSTSVRVGTALFGPRQKKK